MPETSSTPHQRYRIHVLSGIHQGANLILVPGECYLVGSAPDADVILQDADVPAHALLVLPGHEACQLRAMSDHARLNKKEIETGHSESVMTETLIEIGSASLRLTPCEEQTSRLSYREAHPFRRWWPAGTAALLLAGLTLVSSTDLVYSDPQQSRNNAASTRLPVVPVSAPALETPAPSVRINHSVREVLRLSGIDAETRRLSPGVVEIRRYQGNRAHLEQVIQSRAMRAIKGLKKIVIAGTPPRPVRQQLPPIQAIVQGQDAYVLLEDGTRLYPGARVDGNLVLTSISVQQAVFVTPDNEQVIWSLTNTEENAHSDQSKEKTHPTNSFDFSNEYQVTH